MHPIGMPRTKAAPLLAVALLVSALAAAPDAAQGWKQPPADVVAIVDAPPTPAVELSPDARWMLLVERPSLPSIADVARPWVGLAGLRIDPATNGTYQVDFDTGLELRDLTGAEGRRIALPDGARIASVSWSHDSRHFAFTLAGTDSIDLWVADVATAQAKRAAHGLNGVFGAGFAWMPDGVRLLVRLVPEDRGPAPEAPSAPTGPTTMETSGDVTPVRTYQDLLQGPHDEELFAHYALSRLAIVDPRGGDPVKLGEPGLIASAEPSPDGAYVLVERLERPFSYVLPWWRFPRAIEVLDAAGERVHLLAEKPLGENIPIEGVRRGRATSSGRRPSPRRWCGPRRSTAATPRAEAE